MTYNESRNLPPVRTTIKQNAKRMLSRQDLRLKLVFASLICAAVFVMLEYILSYALITPIYSLFPELNAWVSFGIDQIYFVIEFLMLSPLIVGFYALSAGLAQGSDVELSRMFEYYRSPRRLFRAWMLSLITFMPIKLFVTAVQAAFTAGIMGTVLGVLLALVFIGAFTFGFFLYGRLYTFANAVVCGDDQKLSHCFKAAWASTGGRLASIFTFRLSFFLWVLLSFATVGVLFILFTVPYMAVSYSHYSSYLITGEYRIHDSEDLYNE